MLVDCVDDVWLIGFGGHWTAQKRFSRSKKVVSTQWDPPMSDVLLIEWGSNSDYCRRARRVFACSHTTHKTSRLTDLVLLQEDIWSERSSLLSNWLE